MSQYCMVHCCWFYNKRCHKCVAGDPPYLRTRDEVADPDEWKLFKKRGWVKND